MPTKLSEKTSLATELLLSKDPRIIFTFWPIHKNKITQIFSFFQYVKIIPCEMYPRKIYYISLCHKNFFSWKFFPLKYMIVDGPLKYMIVDGQETSSDTSNRFLDSQEIADFYHIIYNVFCSDLNYLNFRKVKEWL